MMPQSNLFVAAPLKTGQVDELRSLLASMNTIPGQADPNNSVVPFGQFERLHFARFVILQDQTLDDVQTAYGLPPRDYPLTLAFIADFDGNTDDFRADLARRAESGLQRIFSHCEEFIPGCDLARWMKDREQPPAAWYGNWLGRTVRQIREENALRLALEGHIQRNESQFTESSPRQVHNLLRDFRDREIVSGKLFLTEEGPTPIFWWLHTALDLVIVPLVLLLVAPLLLLYFPIFIYQLRRREKSDMVIAPRTDPKHEAELSRLEDYDVTNQFSAMGSIKLGRFRRWIVTFFLWLVNYSARHIYTRGHQARVPTIHFARWVFINDKRRMLFASNYDGSLDSYMDDFINKVGWGLNLVFSNGIGYPRTNWLVLDGSKDEQQFNIFFVGTNCRRRSGTTPTPA